MFRYQKIVLFCWLLMGCSKEIQPLSFLRLELTSALYNASTKKITVSGTVLTDIGTEIGIVYAHQTSPTITDNKVIIKNSDGNTFVISQNLAIEMKANEQYYFRLYVLKDGKTTYSNEKEVFNSSQWIRLNDLLYNGFPLPEANMMIFEDSLLIRGMGYNKYHYLTFYTKTNATDESIMNRWIYYLDAQFYAYIDGTYKSPNGFWQKGADQPWRANPIYTRTDNIFVPFADPIGDPRRGIYGAGYFYAPEKQPPYTYAKDVGTNRSWNYTGGDYPTIMFAIHRSFPDYYVLGIGGNYEVLTFNPRLRDTEGWKKVSAFPVKNLTKLLTCTLHDQGYIYSEDTHDFFRYNPIKDNWTKLKNAPFQNREKGVFFSFENVGYYGLGINTVTGEGYKDIWRYNEATDSWIYLIDYPGSGSAQVAVAGEFDHVFLGLGYSVVATALHTSEFYPSHDIWEFKP